MSAAELIAQKHVEPSILSADYARLGEQIELVMGAGARVIHVDVMDGHFVPPITIGPVIVEAIRDQVHDAGGMLDCHLMVEEPEKQQVQQFADAGADSITVQYEATPNVDYALKQVRDAGCLAGLAINPGTPVESVEDLTGDADFILCMTVNPGWGGQAFIEGSDDKVRRLRELVGPELPIQVDGGISTETAGMIAEAGATLFVAGSAVFKADDPVAAYASDRRSSSTGARRARRAPLVGRRQPRLQLLDRARLERDLVLGQRAAVDEEQHREQQHGRAGEHDLDLGHRAHAGGQQEDDEEGRGDRPAGRGQLARALGQRRLVHRRGPQVEAHADRRPATRPPRS